MDRWFVVQTNANAERLAAGSIRELGIEVYLPEYTQRVRASHKKPRLVKKALFPGYLFAKFDINTNPNWPRIFSRRGVSGVIVDSSQRPKPVPEIQMDGVLQMAEDYEGRVLEAVPLSKGDAVTIIHGVFTNFPAVVRKADKSASVIVETQVFGKSHTVILPRAHVTPVAA